MSEHIERVRASIDEFKTRRIAVLWDDSGGSGRAVLVSPAAGISTSLVNELLSLSGGLTFVALSPARAAAFMLSRMSRPAS